MLKAAPFTALITAAALAGCGGGHHAAKPPQDTPRQAADWIMKTRPGALRALCTFINDQGTRLADVQFDEDYNATPYGKSQTAPSADRVFLALVKKCA